LPDAKSEGENMRGKVAALIIGLVLGGAGTGIAATHSGSVVVRPGQNATFKLASGQQWDCFNRAGKSFYCVSGDALPNVEIGPGLTVAVNTLSPSGKLKVRANHYPADAGLSPYDLVIYTFTP
jgi:hypothetical protein